MLDLGEQDIFYHYCDLWKHIESKGVVVQYSDDPAHSHRKGYFVPDGAWNYALTETSARRVRGPLIVICSPPRLYSGPAGAPPKPGPFRYRVDGGPVDLQDELFTLAHEYGHCRSWRASIRSEKPFYDATTAHRIMEEPLSAPLTERLHIVQEERDAWDLGRDFVPPHLQAEYGRVAAAAVSEYENTLEVWRL